MCVSCVGKEETGLIPLVLKDGRSGLGRSSFVLEQKREETIMKQEHEEQAITHFLQRKQQSQTLLRMEGDLRKSQRACEQLDMDSGYTSPIASWYWASVSDQSCEDEDSDDSDTSEEPTVSASTMHLELCDILFVPVLFYLQLIEKLGSLTDYLRDNYFYCVWCGTSYQGKWFTARNQFEYQLSHVQIMKT